MEQIIEIRSLSKKYGDFTAVNDVSMAVEKGTIFGLLGPNGAGKSTLIRVLACQSRPTVGHAYISGLDVVSDRKEVLSIIGVVPQENSFYDELTVSENLNYFGSLYGVPVIEIKKRSHKILDMLKLSEKSASRAGALSGGMKTRLNIACALIHKPDMLILDEPSVGLDPVSRKALWDTIRTVKEEGTTILMTTHYMEEADMLCDRIVIMNRGKIVVEGKPYELKNRTGESVILITSEPGDYQVLKTEIEKKEPILSCNIGEKGLKITLRDEMPLDEILDIFSSHGEKIKIVGTSKPTLEDVFIHAAGEAWH
ncbi:MAG: ABC transporter ATP-binding protein [Candidatus Methanoperedens sp.]|nr:ABC transporter ATP-binding protein [Candidatus Methanoperedens sp.]MCE8425044.1 ABC transporter ATP-binding protein [Candidatus Methanoperedens sp.]MCE8426796.1 ABC transporter ATP-binding protein [Candidatus Methanoperedens sp.]